MLLISDMAGQSFWFQIRTSSDLTNGALAARSARRARHTPRHLHFQEFRRRASL